MKNRMAFAFLALLPLLVTGGCGDDTCEHGLVVLATTTSTDNSGLLEAIIPPFEEAEGVTVKVIAVGTGKALKLGQLGDADIVLVHARSREDAFIAEGYGIDRRDIMWNDFVILGPEADPAGVKGMTDAADALQKIAAANAVFVSRGDDSGTHTCERDLWDSGGKRPDWGANYMEAGQGMGPCITMADQKQGYVLSDRGTFLAYRGKTDLIVLVEGDEMLHNPYGAMLVNPERHARINAVMARRLLDYLTSEACRKRIAEFRVEGEILFHPHGVE